MLKSMLFRSLCPPSRILFASPQVHFLRRDRAVLFTQSHYHNVSPEATTEFRIRKHVAAVPAGALDVDGEHNPSKSIAVETNPRVEDAQTDSKDFRWFSEPIFKDTVYFIEQQGLFLIQGIVIKQMNKDGKEVHGAYKQGQRGEDATPHLASAYGFDFDHLDSIASVYAERAKWKAGSYFMIMDEMEVWGRTSQTRKKPKHLKGCMRNIAWKMEYQENAWSMEKEENANEEKFRAKAEEAWRKWVERDHLGRLYSIKIWENRRSPNRKEWRKIRQNFNRLSNGMPPK